MNEMQTTDIVVGGGGVFGCSVALALARKGLQVTLVDKSLPGRATSASAGGLWPVGEAIGLGCGIIYHQQQKESGESPAAPAPEPLPRCFMEFLLASNDRFAKLGPELKQITGIDIEKGSHPGLLYLLYNDEEMQTAHALLKTMQSRKGETEFWTAEEAWEQEPRLTRDLQGAVFFPTENQVNPMNLSEALKRAACQLGTKLMPASEITGIGIRGGKIREVETTGGTISCAGFVNAAGAWSARLARMAGVNGLPVFPVRGQIVCLDALKKSLNFNLSTTRCYLLQKAHGEIIIGSTTERTEFDPGVKFTDIRNLCAGARRAVPSLGSCNVKRVWAGFRPGTPDEMPLLGPVPQVSNYFNATGGFRTGIVAAPLSGEIVAAFVTGEEPPFPSTPFLMERFDGEPVTPQ